MLFSNLRNMMSLPRYYSKYDHWNKVLLLPNKLFGYSNSESRSYSCLNSSTNNRKRTNLNGTICDKVPCRHFISMHTNKFTQGLLDKPKIVTPSVLKSLKNTFLAMLIIRPYLDHDFTLMSFLEGSKKAVEVVSRRIAAGDFESLEGLVTNDAIERIKRGYEALPTDQRNKIVTDQDDILYSFPYEIGLIFSDRDDSRTVEIMVVSHVFHGYKDRKNKNFDTDFMLEDIHSNMSFCNYRFVKEFRKGAQTDWTINELNHFSVAH